MPLSQRETQYLSGLQDKLDAINLKLCGMAEKHRNRVERSRKKDKDYSLAITIDSAARKLVESIGEMREAIEEYADR